jgi:uncharacterized protein (TIGR00730 family)
MSGSELSAVGVFCGSSPGADPAFTAAAIRLGTALARSGIDLVYGGGSVGLMGVVADAALAAGGRVLGVITEALEAREIAHRSLTELVVVSTMHERKAAMSDAAGAFVMLPGGFGTLEEFFEAVTWTQLGIHTKPAGILDVGGYFAPLAAFFDQAVAQRFVRTEHRDQILIDDDVDRLLDRLEAWSPTVTPKWLDRSDA